jgi:hypothetical protein
VDGSDAGKRHGYLHLLFGQQWSNLVDADPRARSVYFSGRSLQSLDVDRSKPTANVNVAFYDTRNDTTGARFQTDYYLARSTNGGASFPAADIRVSTVSSNEHDCNGIFPCDGINYGNQQGDYEGLVSFNGVSYPIWTDSRKQLAPSSGCRRPLLMEEVFSAVVK